MNDTQNETPLLFLVTGSLGAGKTTFCNSLVKAARESGWKVSGIISQPVFEGHQKTAIDAEDMRTGEKRRLAVRSEAPTPGSKHWQFDNAVFNWGNQLLQISVPCDLLVIDELGPLEFERGEGWQAGLQAIDTRQYAIGIVVVNAQMLGNGMLRWPDANLVEIDTPDDSQRKASILAGQLF